MAADDRDEIKERKNPLRIDADLIKKPDAQAARNASANDIKSIQAANPNAHNGSAGGDQNESLQIIGFEDGKQKIIAERDKQFGKTSSPEIDSEKLIPYQTKQIDNHTFQTGFDLERTAAEESITSKLSRFAIAAEERFTDPRLWQQNAQAELNKIIGIGEGLNIAKENFKASAVAGWNALQDGTVVRFLAQPDAINKPLFKVIEETVGALATNSSAVNDKLEELGRGILSTSNDYSQLTDKGKGKIIGEVMFAMVDPEIPGENPLLAAKTESLSQSGSEASQIGGLKRIDDLEHDSLSMAGSRGEWPTINERPSPDVVQQVHPNACVAAVGEMLSEGRLTQEHLLEKFKEYFVPQLLEKNKYPTADLKWLPKELGDNWLFDFIDPETNWHDFEILLAAREPWAAELREPGKTAHLVVVDGTNSLGHIEIRDPANATRYEMTQPDFLALWCGRSVRRNTRKP